jgi:hypothetical protein
MYPSLPGLKWAIALPNFVSLSRIDSVSYDDFLKRDNGTKCHPIQPLGWSQSPNPLEINAGRPEEPLWDKLSQFVTLISRGNGPFPSKSPSCRDGACPVSKALGNRII